MLSAPLAASFALDTVFEPHSETVLNADPRNSPTLPGTSPILPPTFERKSPAAVRPLCARFAPHSVTVLSAPLRHSPIALGRFVRAFVSP